MVTVTLTTPSGIEVEMVNMTLPNVQGLLSWYYNGQVTEIIINTSHGRFLLEKEQFISMKVI